MAVGGWLNVVCSRAFDRRDTRIKPFEESNALLDDGPFKYSRNPMYLGLILILVGVALSFGTVSPLVLIPAFAWIW